MPASQNYPGIVTLEADHPGMVNTITRHVSSCDCNIADSRLAMLAGEFPFILQLSGSCHAITLIESTLPLKGTERVSRTRPGENTTPARFFMQITPHGLASRNASEIEQASKTLCTELNAQGSISVVNYP